MLRPPPTHHALPLSDWGLALGLQVVAGREYKGSGFLASPNAIIFKDFEVGKPMKIRFLFTNVSLSFNSFKGADWPSLLVRVVRVRVVCVQVLVCVCEL